MIRTAVATIPAHLPEAPTPEEWWATVGYAVQLMTDKLIHDGADLGTAHWRWAPTSTGADLYVMADAP